MMQMHQSRLWVGLCGERAASSRMLSRMRSQHSFEWRRTAAYELPVGKKGVVRDREDALVGQPELLESRRTLCIAWRSRPSSAWRRRGPASDGRASVRCIVSP